MAVLEAPTRVQSPPASRQRVTPRPSVPPTRIHALPNRFHELDGLRGLGALSVLVYHYLIGPATYSHTASRLQEIISVSPLTVDMFFILSGFLVGGILLHTKTSPNYFKTFYMRRLCRIAPLYYLWIFAFVGLALYAPSLRPDLLPKGYGLFRFTMPQATYAQVLFNFPWHQARARWFVTAWSLAVEEHFYLIIPVCMLWLSRRRLILSMSAIVLAAPLSRMIIWQILNYRDVWGVTYVFTPLRSDALAIGILLAVLWESQESRKWFRDRLNWIYFGLAFTVLLSLAIEYCNVKSVPYADVIWVGIGRSSVEASGFFMILLGLVSEGQGSVAFMRWGWARALGKVSYFLYLTHPAFLWMVFRFGLHVKPGFSVKTDVIAGLAALALTCTLAALSWKLFEHPLQKLSHRFVY